MKIKIISLFLCAVLTVLFAACGKQTEAPTETDFYNPDNVSQATQTETEAAQEADADSVNVTIPEGYTLVRISWLLEEKGVCTSAAFLEAAQRYSLQSNTILADAATAENLCFNLEGYLFPATYTFKKGATPEKVLDTMIAATSSRITGEMKNKARELGYSVHEILTVASIIEKEAYTAAQRTLIASVLYNRLKQGMKLQCDVTTKYCTGVIELQYPDKIDFYKYHYNTYRCAALPAGPICNPGMASINAALNPDKTDYLFFVIDTEPPYESVFSATYEEHLENCERMGF